MDNDTIVKRICELENINIKEWHPITEWGEPSDIEFDKTFCLNRTYFWQKNNYKKRIRFVKYCTLSDYITICISKIRVSNITKSQHIDGNEVYFKGYSKDIPLKDINRPFKLNKIMKKMGR